MASLTSGRKPSSSQFLNPENPLQLLLHTVQSHLRIASVSLRKGMVNSPLQIFLEENRLIDSAARRSCQSGFRVTHATTDALTRLETMVRTSLIWEEYCFAIFLNIAQAFNTVWHHGLSMKLQSMGLTGNLPHFVSAFLAMCKIFVRHNNVTSPSYPVHLGVPQGAVLSSTLFIIMINDLFANCPPAVQYAHFGRQSTQTSLQYFEAPVESRHTAHADPSF